MRNELANSDFRQFVGLRILLRRGLNFMRTKKNDIHISEFFMRIKNSSSPDNRKRGA